MLNKKDDILHCRISNLDKVFIAQMAKDNNMSLANFILFKSIYSDEETLLKYKKFLIEQIK